jgi:hypothetical protein
MVFKANAPAPTAVLFDAVVLVFKESLPSATLAVPVVLAVKDR